jgi:hypothetical protein
MDTHIFVKRINKGIAVHYNYRNCGAEIELRVTLKEVAVLFGKADRQYTHCDISTIARRMTPPYLRDG